jgi:hypothetical protein
MIKVVPVLFVLLCFSVESFGEDSSEETRFPVSLVEFAPQLSFLYQTFPVAGTNYYSTWNPGAVIRFTPIWKGRYPIYFYLGGTQLTEQNNAGVTVNGEHGPLKYIWSFGARFGFQPVPRLTTSIGLEFNHEPYLLDEGNQTVFLNKVLVPAGVIMTTYEGWKTSNFSALIDVGMKAYFSVPMDTWLLRNGLVLLAKGGGRWKLDENFTAFANVLLERRAFSTNIGDDCFLNLMFEVGVGFGYGG